MKKITQEELRQHCRHGTWRVLEQRAIAITSLAEKAANSVMRPLLGGGTRLMLAIEHRISDDIDLFIDTPQWLGFLTPRMNDDIEEMVDTYQDGLTSLRFGFPEGEIDYIVGMSLLGLPPEVLPESAFELEPVAEVLAKKLFYRGDRLTPRDLFDWRMVEECVPEQQLHIEKIANALRDKFDGIAQALNTIGGIAPENYQWNSIRTPYELGLQETLEWAQTRLEYYKTLATRKNQGSASKPRTA